MGLLALCLSLEELALFNNEAKDDLVSFETTAVDPSGATPSANITCLFPDSTDSVEVSFVVVTGTVSVTDGC